MKNEKIKFIGLNMLLSIPSSAALFLVISIYHPASESALLASVYYLIDVLNQSSIDYLESEIKKLKDKLN